jgi:predicted transcriptional regulator
MIELFERAEAEIYALARASVRAKVILFLKTQPASINELAAELKTEATTIHHYTPLMLKEGIIRKAPGVGRKYALTNKGEIQALLLAELARGLITLKENEAFWQTHDLSGIPDHLKTWILQLSGGRLVSEELEDPLKSQAAFIDSISRARSFVWGISPITAPGYDEMILGLVEKGVNVSLLLSRSVVNRIDKAALKSVLAAKNFRLYEIPEGVKVAFTVTEELTSIALFNPDGSYDPQQDLICEGPDAVEWGKALFRHYLNQAKLVQSV